MMTPKGSSKIQSSLSEINVTPLVDVMLVLLIVFMVTAPLLQQGLQVELPKANTGALQTPPLPPLIVTVNSRKQMAVNQEVLNKTQLIQKLRSELDSRTQAKAPPESLSVYLQADRNLSYGYVTEFMAELRRSGIFKIGLVTEPLE